MVAVGTDEPVARKVGGKTGLPALGEAAERVAQGCPPETALNRVPEVS